VCNIRFISTLSSDSKLKYAFHFMWLVYLKPHCPSPIELDIQIYGIVHPNTLIHLAFRPRWLRVSLTNNPFILTDDWTFRFYDPFRLLCHPTLEPQDGLRWLSLPPILPTMAADLAPASFQQWSFEKAQAHEDSPVSESSEDFYDAVDKIRIAPTMNEIRAALNEKSPVFNNKEYLSSEEALSPVMDEEPELSEAEEIEADVEIEPEELTEVDLWEGIKVFALDIAITLSMQFVGPPKIIDLHMPSYSNATELHVAPLRFDSLPAKSERRTQVRAPEAPVSSPRHSGSSLDALSSPTTVTEIFTDSPDTLHSRFSGSSYTESPIQSPTSAAPAQAVRSSSEYAESIKSLRRNGSIFSVAEHNISANWTPPLNEEGSSSPASSFLQSDPFDNSSQAKPTHNRVRSISSRFPKFSFGSKKEGKTDEEKALKKERRNSFFRPSTPTSIYDGISTMASRDSARPSLSQQPSFIAPLSIATTPRRMVARAANERASPISLPPCPDDFSPPTPELLRSHTLYTAPIARKPLGSPVNMKRRRSMLGLG
jgi:hypothetical protein